MAWATSNRRQSLPRGWDKIRRRILARDRYRCVWVRVDTGRVCGEPATDVDHIIPNFEGGGDEDSNLASCCSFHHSRKSSAEGGRAASEAAARRKAATKRRHPGLLP